MLAELRERWLDWRRRRMFKRVVFEFSGPICNCPEANVEVRISNQELEMFIFECKDCKVRVTMPRPAIKTSMTFQTPYPGRPKQTVSWSKDSKSEEKK